MNKKSEEGVPPPAKKPARRPKRDFEVNVYSAWCKSCGICIEFCPKGVLGEDKDGKAVVVDRENCSGCTLCMLHCPDFAITIDEKKKEEDEESSGTEG